MMMMMMMMVGIRRRRCRRELQNPRRHVVVIVVIVGSRLVLLEQSVPEVLRGYRQLIPIRAAGPFVVVGGRRGWIRVVFFFFVVVVIILVLLHDNIFIIILVLLATSLGWTSGVECVILFQVFLLVIHVIAIIIVIIPRLTFGSTDIKIIIVTVIFHVTSRHAGSTTSTAASSTFSLVGRHFFQIRLGTNPFLFHLFGVVLCDVFGDASLFDGLLTNRHG
mmetsp:Transcript_25470/g.59752  ORF Transcript_25470/g.59752 Transcript_25470/m.59752 type:complete len:220 (+) Transcript_25470:1115-1774(+)